MPYMECSAKNDDSVEEVFNAIGKMVKARFIDKKLSEEGEGTNLSDSTGPPQSHSKCCKAM